MTAEHIALVSGLDEEQLFRLTQVGLFECIAGNPELKEELGVPKDQLTLSNRFIRVTFPQGFGATIEVLVDFKVTSTNVSGYYSIVFEDDMSIQDDFFVINP